MKTIQTALLDLSRLDTKQYYEYITTTKIHKHDKIELLNYHEKGILSDVVYNYLKRTNW